MKNAILSEQRLADVADVLRAIGHDTRLRLIDTLRVRGEMSVGELEEATGILQPALSQQLAVLRKAELVRTRRAAKQVYYSIAAETFEAVTQFLMGVAQIAAPPALPRSAKKGRGSAAMFARML